MSEPLIKFWSYSSMSALLSNPMAFKKKYVLKLYDEPSSPSGVVGVAAHKAIEMFLKGMPVDAAITEGQKTIDQTTDMGIVYGKTGSRAQIVNDYHKVINAYLAEIPDWHELLAVEESFVTEITSVTGGTMGLPAKAKIDLITRNLNGEIEVVDHKFVGKGYTDPEVDDFRKWLQGMFDYYIIKAKYGEAPARIVYNEVKISTNKDGSPQLRPWTIEFNNADFLTFERLYNDATRLITNEEMIFLPNPNDMFSGQDTFELYRMGTLDVDRPVSVRHATEQREFVEQRYVPTASNQVEYKDLSMEERIRLKLQEFRLPVDMRDTHVGPSVTQYTMTPGRGISMSKVASMERDLALALEVQSLRIEAPMPGTGLVGVEVPSTIRRTVELGENHMRPGTMQIPIGINVFNEVVYKDLAEMPHLLIAGATGAGKSVMLNVILQSLTRQLNTSQLELVLIDPKQVELAQYESDSHLKQLTIKSKSSTTVERLPGIITQPIDAVRGLNQVVEIMEHRYKLLARGGVRKIQDYKGKMSNIVVVVDEFADLMMTDIKPSADSMDVADFTDNLKEAIFSGRSGKLTQKAVKAAIKTTLEKDSPPSAEESIIRIAQKARAVGIHLILATQRPSADVVTGLIKANIPTKIAFMTTNKINSQIVLDATGAEELTGKGDMLFADPSHNGLQRLQGLYA